MALKPVQRIVALYILVGMGSTYGADRLLELFVHDAHLSASIEHWKDVAYVVVSGVWLYRLVRAPHRQLHRAHHALARNRDETINALVRTIDFNHRETADHTARVTRTTVELGRLAGLENEALIHLERGATLHDIGKIGIPDEILVKPGKLTEAEQALVRQHPLIGKQLLESMEFLRPSVDIVYCHHEHWDGGGYPQGLSGERIPLPARLLAIVDTWDALIHHRVYKPAWPESQVFEYLRKEAGGHFDPDVVRLFLLNYERLKAIAEGR